MNYFGIEISDGKIYSDFPLNENEPLESQWFFLTSDVGGIDYNFRGYSFSVSITWFGDALDVFKAENGFYIRIYEGLKTDGKTFYQEYIAPDLRKLKEGMQNAVDFIETIKRMQDHEILSYPAIPYP